MTIVLKFFASYAILIYLVLAIGLMFAMRALMRARHELGESVFGLERELAHRHISQAVTALTLVLLLGVGELVLTVFLIPNLPAFALLFTPTMNPLTTPTRTLPPGLLATLGALTPQPTPTAESTGCVPGQIMITSPKPGDIIKGNVELIGTADIPNFGFYYYEFAPIGSDNWQTLPGGNKVIQDKRLGYWDTSTITPGYYNLGLVVTDNQARKLPTCIVPVQIAAP
jgi:hypothetical protein